MVNPVDQTGWCEGTLGDVYLALTDQNLLGDFVGNEKTITHQRWLWDSCKDTLYYDT